MSANPPDDSTDPEAAEPGFEEELRRRQAEADLEVPIVAALQAGRTNPVQPVRYRGTDSMNFRCHRGVSCWNECCHDTDITLTPFDLVRLARRRGSTPGQVAAQFGVISLHEPSDMPVLRLATVEGKDGRRPCVFLDPDKGCTVYEDRPAACRYYPLGLATVKMKGHDAPENFYFLVRETHCRGHDEDRPITVDAFREEQGVDGYDERNQGWIHILMKLASWKALGGPWGKEPDGRTKRMFLLATTDLDAFRKFVFESSFLQRYAIDERGQALLAESDDALLQLGFDWMRNILFNEPTLHLRETVLHDAIAKARAQTGAT